MRNKFATGAFLIVVASIAIIAIMASCAKKIVNSPRIGVPITISAKAFEAASPAQKPDSFILTVDARDIANQIIVSLTLENGYLVGQAIIPAGQSRHFVVTAFSKGKAIYRGEMTADVYPGAQLELRIDMRPVAPILNITPHFSQVAMDNSFTVDINAFNLQKLEFITMRFACDSIIRGFNKPIWIDSVAPGSGVNLKDARFTYHLDYSGTRDTAIITIGSVGNIVSSFLDSTGNGQLATVYLHTSSDYPFDTFSALLNLPADPESYLHFFGDEGYYYIGTNDSIHVDDAVVSMVREPAKPTAPRLELAPRYQEIRMNDSFVLDLNAYNEPNLQSIYLYITYTNLDSSYTTSPPMYLDSVTRGADLDSTAFVYYYQYNRTIEISISRGEASVPGTPILGPTGSGQLAKLYFNSYSDYAQDTAWVKFNFDNGWLYFPNNVIDSLPGGRVKADNAFIEFWQSAF